MPRMRPVNPPLPLQAFSTAMTTVMAREAEIKRRWFPRAAGVVVDYLAEQPRLLVQPKRGPVRFIEETA